jgi:hypothetical protein
MKSMLLAAVSVLALSSIGQARAESNGLAAVEPPQAAVPVLSSPPLGNTGSETYPSFAEGRAVPVMSGQVLPPNGSEGAVQSANSLLRPAFQRAPPPTTLPHPRSGTSPRSRAVRFWQGLYADRIRVEPCASSAVGSASRCT